MLKYIDDWLAEELA